MGFCSGTDIFDPVAKFVLESEQPDAAKADVLRVLIEALWDHDWDCESDSAYYDHPIVRQVFQDLKPDWFEEDEDDT